MADRIKFEGFGDKLTGLGGAGQGTMGCEACESMCLDAVDGTLTAAEQVVFDRHVAGCVECAEQLSEARRGAAWMEMLKGHRPEPPAGMLQRILAQTSEAEMSRVFPRFGEVPTPVFNVVPKIGFQERMLDRFAATFKLDLRQSHFQPRMAMTAAMAFFSLALTMNLSGVRLADLKPGAIHRTVADVRASAARSFQNLKVVYQVESTVNELRNDDRDPGGPFAGGDGSSTAPKQQTPAAGPAPRAEKPKGSQDKQGNQDKQGAPQGTSELVEPGVRGDNMLTSSIPQYADKQQIEQQAGQQIARSADALRVQRGA